MSTDLLSLTEAAKVAGVNPASLRHAIRDGRLAATKAGAYWVVNQAEIDRYISERSPGYPRTGTTLYYLESLPNEWVVEHGGEIWLVPNIPNGWNKRRPYRGHRTGLEPVAEQTARLMMTTCGIPN